MDSKIESGVQLFSRLSAKKENLSGLNTKLCKEENLQNISLEIVSNYKIDKNHLLIDFIIRCILPTNLNPSWKNCGVLFMNTTFQIGVFQIIKCIDKHLKDINVKNRQEIIENSLKNLIFLDCFDMTQFEITIFSLEEKIKKKPNICCLVVDELTSFYWLKKLEDDSLSSFMYAQKNFTLINDAIKGLNIFFVFGRIENNLSNQDKRLCTNVDYQVFLDIDEDDKSYKAKVRSYKSNQIDVVKYTYQNFKVSFV